jgi:hypothetical protein
MTGISAHEILNRVNHVNRLAAHGRERLSTSVDRNLILCLHQEWG